LNACITFIIKLNKKKKPFRRNLTNEKESFEKSFQNLLRKLDFDQNWAFWKISNWFKLLCDEWHTPSVIVCHIFKRHLEQLLDPFQKALIKKSK